MKSKGSVITLLVLLLSINVLSVSSFVPIEDLPNKTLASSYLTVGDFTWTEAALAHPKDTGYATPAIESFGSTITDTTINVYELPNANYGDYAGVYALVPVINDTLYFTFEGRASANYKECVIMGLATIDPSDMKYLNLSRPYDLQSQFDPNYFDTGYNSFEYNFTLQGYTEVYLYFYYVDATTAFWDQNIWVDDLRIYTDSAPSEPEPEPEPESSEFLSVKDFIWIEAALAHPSDTGYATPATESFGSTITDTTINVYELPNSNYHVYAGVYALVPVVNNTLSFSFQGRASANYKECVIMGLATIDPSDMKYLNLSRPYDLQSQFDPNFYDTGYNPFVYNFTLQGYTEVYLYFYYVDATTAFWDQNIWVDDLKIDTLVDLPEEEPIDEEPIDNDSPIISGSESLAIESGTTGNYVTWTLTDDNPSIYIVYRDDNLFETKTWLSPAAILVNIDFLVVGIHNFTIIAYDSNGNYAVDTVVVVVVSENTFSTEPTMVSFTLPIFFLLSITFIVFRRRK